MVLHLPYDGPQVDSDRADVNILDVIVQVGNDVFEEEEPLIILVDLVVLPHVLLAGQILIEAPEMLILLPSAISDLFI